VDGVADPGRAGNRRGNYLPGPGAAHRADRDRLQPADHRVLGLGLRRRIHRPHRPHHTTPTAAALLAAVGCGSFAWFAVLSGAVAIARRRIGPRGLRIGDGLSGLGIMGFGGLLGLRAFGHT
jgi:hypothetical protein